MAAGSLAVFSATSDALQIAHVFPDLAHRILRSRSPMLTAKAHPLSRLLVVVLASSQGDGLRAGRGCRCRLGHKRLQQELANQGARLGEQPSLAAHRCS